MSKSKQSQIKHEDSTNTLLQQLITVTDEFMKINNQPLDYKKIVKVFVELCSAKYAVFNLFSQNGENFKTVAFSGNSKLLDTTTKYLGFNIIGKSWDSNSDYLDKIKKNRVTEFHDLEEIVGDSLPIRVTDLIASVFKIGKVYVFIIERNNRILGEFTAFIGKNSVLENRDMIELFTNQVGLLLSRYQSEQALKKEQVIANSIVNSIQDILVMTDKDGYITFVNQSARKMIDSELIGQLIFDVLLLCNINDSTSLYNDYHKIYKQYETVEAQEITMELERNGQEIYIEYSLMPINDQDLGELGYMLLLRDKTLKHREHKHIQYLSNHDQLTTLYNRRYFEESLVNIDHIDNLPLSIIMGDLNGLKLINDSFGHSIGDELLINAAYLLRKFTKPNDILARIGGDEFVMILPNTSKKQALSLVDDIRDAAISIIVDNTNVSISMGVASKTTISKPINKVLFEAEEEMYRRKLLESSSVHSKTIEMVMKSLFEKNEREMNHSQRVSELCQKIAQHMGLNKETIDRITIAGLMHDIGKIAIPEKILNKSDRLSEEEYNIVKKHSEVGYRILASVNEFSDISRYVLEHHERIDGKGYPKGLFGEEIHPLSKIICVADAFDAMTNARTYGNILSIDEALLELKENKHTQFDEDVVEAVKRIYQS